MRKQRHAPFSLIRMGSAMTTLKGLVQRVINRVDWKSGVFGYRMTLGIVPAYAARNAAENWGMPTAIRD